MKLLFVCLGNICRSPTAHGVFEQIASSVSPGLVERVDSAGTAAFRKRPANTPRRREVSGAVSWASRCEAAAPRADAQA